LRQRVFTWLRGIPLRWRLTAWYVFLLALILAGFSAFIYFNMSRSLKQGLDSLLFIFPGGPVLTLAFTTPRVKS